MTAVHSVHQIISVHLMGMYLIGVDLTGVYLMGVYLTGVQSQEQVLMNSK